MLVLPITAATYIDASCWKPSGGQKLNKGPDCIKPADRQLVCTLYWSNKWSAGTLFKSETVNRSQKC